MQKTKVICDGIPDHAKAPPRGEPLLGEGRGVAPQLGEDDVSQGQQRQGGLQDPPAIPPLEIASPPRSGDPPLFDEAGNLTPAGMELARRRGDRFEDKGVRGGGMTGLLKE